MGNHLGKEIKCTNFIDWPKYNLVNK